MQILQVIDFNRAVVGSVELSDEVFGAPINVALVHQVLKAQMAGRRRGTAKTKVKSEVRGGGRKPFKQKGTGRARQGSSRSPLQPGGGQNFGPQPRSYQQFTPKEMIRGALRSALSDRVKAGRIVVLNELRFDSPKTKVLRDFLGKKLAVDQVLVVDDANFGLELSGRNLPRVKVLRTEGMNVYDIIRNEWIVITRRAIEQLNQKLQSAA